MTNYSAFGRYYPADSWLHRLNATLKLFVALVVFFAVFLQPNLSGLAVLTLIFILLWASAKLPLTLLGQSLRPLLFIIAFTATLHFFWPQANKQAFTYESFLAALFFSGRLILAVFYAHLLTLTTTPIQLAQAVENLLQPLRVMRLPTKQIALSVTIALRFIPIIYQEAYLIMKAQEARGAHFKQAKIKNLKLYLALLIPLFVVSFKRALELAEALQLRGVSGDGRASG